MDLSIYLAKVMGLYLVIAYVSVLTNNKIIPSMIKDIIKDKGLMMFGGALALIMGLLVVLTHNIWSADWIGLVTLLGWVVLVKGAVMFLFPGQFPKWATNLNSNAIIIASVVMLVIGIYLTYIGFTV